MTSDGGTKNRVTVAEAAKELGLSVATVRYWMETGKLDIGIYLKKRGGKRAMYVVLRDKLNTVLGKREDDECYRKQTVF